MARSFTSILTAVAMLAHSILGCCAHHVHAEECEATHALCDHSDHEGTQSDCENSSVEEANHQTLGHDHDKIEIPVVDEHRECCSTPADSCPHGLCDEGSCQFVESSPTKVPGPDDAGTAVDVAGTPIASSFALTNTEGERFTVPPVRGCEDLCASSMTQVWRL